MNKSSITCVILAVLACSSSAETPIGGGMKGDQVAPVITRCGSGFLVAWQDSRIDGKGWGIGVQKLSALLVPMGTPMRGNTQTVNHQESPKVASFTDGGVVLVWQSGRAGQRDIVFRQIDGAGGWLRNESFANTHRPGDQTDPSLKVLSDNTFLVTWSSQQQFKNAPRAIVGQRFSRNGVRLGAEFRIDDMSSHDSGRSEIIPEAGGSYRVVWTANSHLGFLKQEIRIRSFGQDGSPLSGSAALVGLPSRIEEYALSSLGEKVDMLVRKSEDGTVALYSIEGTAAVLFREMGSAPGGAGVSVRSELDGTLCSWITRRNDGLGSAAYSVEPKRLNPGAAPIQKLSVNPGLAEISPTLFRVNPTQTGAVWSKLRGNNGFDVIVDLK